MNYQNLSKGLSTASGAAPVVLGDIQNMYQAYNPVFEGNPYQNFNVGANYNQLLNQDPEYMSNNIQSVGAGKMFLNSQKNALEGASAFSSLGPWGMLGGAVGGTVMSIGTDLLNNTVGKQRQQQRVDLYNKDLRTRYDTALATSLDMAREQQIRNRTVQPFAVGGDLSTQAPGEYNEFNVGGSHEANPFGGIPQGIGANGQQNVVEEGEVKFNDYIYTNRISLADNVRDQFNIPITYSRKSYADIAKALQEESKERPNDPISQKGMQAMMSRLKDAQEYQKLEEAAAEEDMSIEEYMASRQQQNSFADGGELPGPGDPIKPEQVLSTYSVVSTDGASKPVNNKKGLYDKAVEAYPILNPNNWGVEDFSYHKEFGNAYKDARTKGLKEFMWNGKRYNSQNSGTPTQQHAMYGNVNAQVDSEVSDKTSTRIIQNSITGKGVINPELLERNFTINTLAGSPEYKHTTLSKLENKRYNNYLSNNNLPNVPYTDKDRNTFTEEHRKRSMYNMITGNIIGHDYIDEEAHGYQGTQYKENDFVTMAKYWVNNPFFTKEQQYKLYDDPNSYEYDAHTIVQPVLEAYQNGDISKDEIPIYIKNMQQHKEDAFLWEPYTLGDKRYMKVKTLQDALTNMGAFLGEETGVIGERTLRALKQYQTAVNNNQPVQFTYFDKDELAKIDYKTASELEKILIGKELSDYGFDARTPNASGFSEEAVQKRLEMFKTLYNATPPSNEEATTSDIPLSTTPNYNRTPNKYGKAKKNINRNEFALGGNLDGLTDPPIVFDPNALRNSDPKLQPQYTQVDNTNTVQRQNEQKVTPIKVKKQSPTYQVDIPTVAIPQQTITPLDNTRTVQSYGISPEEVSVIQNQNFLERFVQTAPTTPEMYQQELEQLHPEDRAVAEAIGYETIADARQNWMDATQGSITPGRDYNKVQEWWRNYTSTAKGQELVKFINNPQLNMMAGGLNPTAMYGMMGADWANQYGQGASAEELGKTITIDLATMALLGRIQGGDKMNLLPETTAFKNNPFPIKNVTKAATQMPTRGNPIEPINVKFPKPNLNPKTNLLGTPGTKYGNLGNKSYPYKDNLVSKGIKDGVPFGLASAFIYEGLSIPGNIEAEKQYIKQQDMNNEVGLLRDNLDAFYRTAGRATEEDIIINQEALESIYLFKNSYKTYKDSLTAGDLELLKAIGIDLETDK